jgi:hypothetical protein
MQHQPIIVSPSESHEDAPRISGVVVGLFLGFDEAGEPLVDYPGNPAPAAIRARRIASITVQDRGRDAALLFEGGDPAKPILVGLIQNCGKQRQVGMEMDGQTLEFRAEKQIVLRCGDASITLTRAGKVLIRGKYVLSSSSGVNMMKGGVIHLN